MENDILFQPKKICTNCFLAWSPKKALYSDMKQIKYVLQKLQIPQL